MPNVIPNLFATPDVDARRRDDGCLSLRSRQPLGEYPGNVGQLLRDGAEAHPDRPLVTRSEAGRRGSVSWSEARGSADALAQALLDRGLDPERPLMILSGNSIEHLLVSLAAQTVGVPVLPISAAYSLSSRDHARVKAIVDLCRPALVFADDAQRFGPVLDAIAGSIPAQVIATGARKGAEQLDDLAATSATGDVERAFAAVGPDSVAKIMFTSGSTGVPKGVITTHRMLCSNQQALGQVWPFLREEPPVLVDWLPWSHTFGGSHNVNQVLAFGGTLHIDDGKPTPQLFDLTLQALRETAPTVYYNVPAGYALLTPRLERDRELAEAFFSRLRFMFYAAAALPQDLWERLRAIANEVADHLVPLTASWGTTETAPGATTAHFSSARCGCIGVPLPGVELKLVPTGAKYEIRVKGPNVTPGYHRNSEATAAAFDEEGYYRTGDAVRLVDPDDPDQGLMFDGRLSEDFKLTSGTWVTVGRIRTGLVSAARGVITDAVIAGHDREHVAALVWINQDAARAVCGAAAEVPHHDERLRDHLAMALRRHNESGGSASRIVRLLILSEPPDPDAGEITDKGYINQRAVLDRRAAEIERLFAEPLDAAIVLPAPLGAPHFLLTRSA